MTSTKKDEAQGLMSYFKQGCSRKHAFTEPGMHEQNSGRLSKTMVSPFQGLSVQQFYAYI